MKRFICYAGGTILLCAILVCCAFFGIVLFPKDVFCESYQSAIQDKFRALVRTEAPKIIVVSGSSSAFGIDQDMLEEATGYKVVNLGVHAGYGNLFCSELAKRNLNAGDIVLLGYEYNWHAKDAFTDIHPELVMSGIDSDIEMYRYLPIRTWPAFWGYLFSYAEKKNTYVPSDTGFYRRTVFDGETGQMTAVREDTLEDYFGSEDTYGHVDIRNAVVSEESIRYLRAYKAYAEKRGAAVYFIAPPLLKEASVGNGADYRKLTEQEESLIGIPYISDPAQYLYPGTLIFDFIYHCNSRGEKVRTKQLIQDLDRAGAVPVDNMAEYAWEKDDQIIFENDLAQYLAQIRDARYSVFMTAGNIKPGTLPAGIAAGLQALGIDARQPGKFEHSYYAAILSNGVHEDYGAKLLTGSGTIPESQVPYAIISAAAADGDTSSILINEQEYARKDPGMHIVVYNNETQRVVDTVSFDSENDFAASR